MQPRTRNPETDAPRLKPLHAPLPPDVSAASFMRVPAVATACGTAKSTIWYWVRTGRFPKPVKFGAITAWRTSDVMAFLSDPEAWRSAHQTTELAS